MQVVGVRPRHDILRKARSQNNSEIWTIGGNPVRKIKARLAARHHYVAEHSINFQPIAKVANGLDCGSGLDDIVSEALEPAHRPITRG